MVLLRTVFTLACQVNVNANSQGLEPVWGSNAGLLAAAGAAAVFKAAAAELQSFRWEAFHASAAGTTSWLEVRTRPPHRLRSL